MNSDQLAKLISLEENEFLEFKERIDIESKEGKGKFLKELLALANSCTSQSFLIIGIEDKTKNPVGCIGITEEKLQQIVSRYCRPAVIFNFHIVPWQDVQVGVIQIYHRYHYHTLKESYNYLSNGRDIELRDKQVFIRRGSTVAEATPDEIVEMTREEAMDLAAIVSGLDKITDWLEEISFNQKDSASHSTVNDVNRTLETTFCAILTSLFMVWANEFSFATIMAALVCFAIITVTTTLRWTHYGTVRAIITSIIVGLFLGLVYQFSPGRWITEYLQSLTTPMQLFFALSTASVCGIGTQLLINNIEHRITR